MKAKLHILLPFALLSFGANALAQSIVVSTDAVNPGQTAQIALSYVAGATVTNLDFTMSYDETVVDESLITVDCSTSIPELLALTCSVDTTNNQVKGIGTNFTTDELSSTAGFAVVDFPVLTTAAIGDSVSPFLANFANTAGGIVDTQESTWTLTVNPPPQPTWNATATGDDPSAMSGQIGTAIASIIEVDNDSGEPLSVLNYTCTVSGGDAAKFTLTGDTTDFDVPQAGPHGFMGLACDSSALGTFSSTLSCVHNDLPNTPSDTALSCEVNEGPLPQFLGVDNGLTAMDVVEQGDPDAVATLSVSNNGDAGTTLIGSCVYAGDTEITVANGTFAVAQGDPAVNVLARCSGAAEGSYTGTLTCGPTDPQAWIAADSPYAVSCTVGPPGDAVYSSDPAPGAVFDMTTPGEAVPTGTMIPDQDLVITNAAPEANDRDLDLLRCGLTSEQPVGATPADVSAISATAAASPLAAMASTTVTFSCDSTVAGDFTDTYSCDYDVDGDGEPDGNASYTINCSVREAESEVDASPADGTLVTIYAPLGGAGQASVTFDEVLDENEDATLNDCYFEDDTYFSIVSPASFPQTISSGESVVVTFEGRGTLDNLGTTTTLYCDYTDSQSEGSQVSWPVEVIVLAAGIPTLSTWGLMLMILTLLGLGGLVIRRKEHS